ncbi:MAG: LEA type 2 family protein [Leptospiraceae bacterium]|nr:LEA type 2 family protein [Leptospiraceae bacterium]
MMSVKKLPILLVLASLFALAQCNVIAARQNLKNCKFSLEDVSLENMSFSGIDLGIVIGVENVNPAAVIVDRMDATIFLDGQEVGKGQNSSRVEIPAGEKKEVSFKLHSGYGQVGTALLSNLKGSGEIPYKLVGTAYLDVPLVGQMQFPFVVEDTLKR